MLITKNIRNNAKYNVNTVVQIFRYFFSFWLDYRLKLASVSSFRVFVTYSFIMNKVVNAFFRKLVS